MVEERLAEGWSPERISGRLRREGEPMAGRQWIQRHVHADRRAGGRLWRHPRRRGKRPNRKGGAHAGRGHIPGRADIPERPAVVEGRERVGDREADTIAGAGTGGAVVSLVDRASKYALPPRFDGKTAAAVGAAMTGMLGSLPVHTVTVDNGREFAGHARVPAAPGADFLLPRPHHSRERGPTGHTNGLVRGYLPKARTCLESGGRRGQGRPGPPERPASQGPWLPDAGGGVPSGAASLRESPGRIALHAPRAVPGAPAGMPCAARITRIVSLWMGPSRSCAESGGSEGAKSATPGPFLRSGYALAPGRARRCASEWHRGFKKLRDFLGNEYGKKLKNDTKKLFRELLKLKKHYPSVLEPEYKEVYRGSILLRDRPAFSEVEQKIFEIDPQNFHKLPEKNFYGASFVKLMDDFHFPLVGSKPPTSSRILLQLERIVL